MRRIARLALLLWALGAALALGLTLYRIATTPGLGPWREATLAEISATTEALMARHATSDNLAALLDRGLNQSPRNWLALDALRREAQDRALALPAPLLARFDRLKAEDAGLLAQTGACLTCAWDIETCALTQVFLCQAPIALTPLGDVMGLARGLGDYARGTPVDRLDLSLSVVGLGATLAAVPSGGSSAMIKAGAGVIKTAARMGRLSAPLRQMFETALVRGIHWDRVAGTDWLADPARLIRPEAFAPATSTVAALGDLLDASDLTTVLHILPLVDTAPEAEALARIARAGTLARGADATTELAASRFVAKVEVLGKSRLLRATLRLSRLAEGLVASFLALTAALSSLLASTLDHRLRRALRATAHGRSGV